MKTDDVPFEGVGNNACIDHVAVQTAFGMMIAATTLFRKLGYIVHPDRKAEGTWGKAIFMVKDGSIPIQLTDSSNDSPIPNSENHFGIMVDDPWGVAYEIQEWAHLGGVSATPEKVPGGKYFISIPQIITIPIELVPNPDACPTCHGKGTVRRGREGQGFDYDCDTCGGSGQKQNHS